MKKETKQRIQSPTSSVIKIIGVGGGGSNAVKEMFKAGITNADLVICNTDHEALLNNPVPNKIQLGESITEGRGAGNSPLKGRKSAIEDVDKIREVLIGNTKMVILVTAMGGGTGTGATPIIAKIAKELGLLTVVIVTIPFRFEGSLRINQAYSGITEVERDADSVIVINNEKLKEKFGDLKLSNAFSKSDLMLESTVRSIVELLSNTSLINISFSDLRTSLENSRYGFFGKASYGGKNRALDAIKLVIEEPLLNNINLENAESIILNISSGKVEVTMDEIGIITDYLQGEVHNDCKILWGNSVDENLGEKLEISIIVLGYNSSSVTGENKGLSKQESVNKQEHQASQYPESHTEKDLSLFFIDDEYSSSEIAEIISLLSDLYKEIGGDELVIKGTNIHESYKVLEPQLV